MSLKIKSAGKRNAASRALDAGVGQKLQQAEALRQAGRLQEAIAAFSNILQYQPQNFDAVHLLGVVAYQTSNYQLATDLIAQAIAINPNSADAYNNRGLALAALGQFAAAVTSFENAIRISPNNARAYCNRGNAFKDLKQLDAAIASYDKAIAIDRRYAEAYNNRGNALQDLKKPEAAIDDYDKAISLNPNYADAYNNRGNALIRLNKPEAAVASYENAIRINPHHAAAYNHCGVALKEINRLAAAVASFDKAIGIQGDYSAAHWNKSMTLLSGGDYEGGWRLYEWRWKDNEFPSEPLVTSRPMWTGARNKRVLAWAEQGIGDEIMFGSVLPELQSLCSRLTVTMDPRLIPLFKRSMPKEIVFIPRTETLAESEYDEHIPMGSLCRYLRPGEESFHTSRPGYLTDNQERTNAVGAALKNSGSPGRKRVGISWRSNNEKTRATRSIALKDLVAGISLSDVDFVNLQYGDTHEEIEKVRSELGADIVSCSDVDNFNDLDGLASLIEACDLVVSVDNATVHLAGALGKDTRVLLPFAPDWRWMLDRQDSPWYPAIKLYRQNDDRNWADVLERLRSDLV